MGEGGMSIAEAIEALGELVAKAGGEGDEALDVIKDALADGPEWGQEELQRALDGLGSAWRGDWADFDGRTLRSQLGDATTILYADEPKAAADAWLIEKGVCPEHVGWFQWCPDGCQHAAANDG